MGNILDGAHFHSGGDEGGSGFIGLLLIIVVIWATTCSKKENNYSNSTPASYTQPDVSTKYITLKRGAAPIRVYIPSGYRCDCTGGGKKYYHQEQNGPRNLMGDGKFHPGGEHAAYVDLSYYNKEITVTCEFIKL